MLKNSFIRWHVHRKLHELQFKKHINRPNLFKKDVCQYSSIFTQWLTWIECVPNLLWRAIIIICITLVWMYCYFVWCISHCDVNFLYHCLNKDLSIIKTKGVLFWGRKKCTTYLGERIINESMLCTANNAW